MQSKNTIDQLQTPNIAMPAPAVIDNLSLRV